MMTPPGVNLAMLSATLHNPHAFASWVETVAHTTVHLCGTTRRPVPLSHHMLLHHPAAALAPKRTTHDAPKTATTTTCTAVVRTQNQPFAPGACDGIISTCAALTRAPPKYQMSAGWHLAAAARELQGREQLPAIAFVFSRAKTEALATAVRANLSPNPQAGVAAFAAAVHRLPNWREHTAGAEYQRLEGLVRRGIAYHHSGITPVLKEAVECVFAAGHIMLLVSTETFAIGVNMPARAVLFTDVAKRTGRGVRPLYTHEYTQMAGRAGRRGLDTTGNVYVLPAMCRELPTRSDIQRLTAGAAPAMESRFKLHLGLILRLRLAGTDAVAFAQQTMMANTIDARAGATQVELAGFEAEIDDLGNPTTDELALAKLAEQARTGSQKSKRRAQHALRDAEQSEMAEAASMRDRRRLLQHLRANATRAIAEARTYIKETVRLAIEALEELAFVSDGTVTAMGIAAAHIQETNSLATATLMCSGELDSMDAKHLAALLSGFYPLRTTDTPGQLPAQMVGAISVLTAALERTEEVHARYTFDVAESMGYHTGLVAPMLRWCDAETATECEGVLAGLEAVGVFRGELIKAVLKVNAAAKELATVAALLNKPALACTLDQICGLTLKHIATSQSLYLELHADTPRQLSAPPSDEDADSDGRADR